MNKNYGRLGSGLLVLVFAAACGCGVGNSGAPDHRTPAEYFRERQANTMTPYGKVLTDTVEEMDDRIQFKTADGKQWRVGYAKRADNTYDWGTPDEVK